jgi:hypothetical protein
MKRLRRTSMRVNPGFRHAGPGERALLLCSWFCLWLFLWLPAAPVFGAETETESPSIEDRSTVWAYGITEFETDLESSSLQSLEWRLPLLLREELRDCPLHFYSAAELRDRKLQVRRERLQNAADEITSLRAELDELFFSDDSESRTRERKEKLGEQLEVALREQDRLRAVSAEEVEVPRHKPAAYREGNAAAGLFPFPEVPPWIPMRKAGIDFLITGTAEEMGGLLFVEVRGYRRDSRTERLLYRGNFRLDRIEEGMERASWAIRETVYGRELADLTLTVDPASARVELVTSAGRREAGAAPSGTAETNAGGSPSATPVEKEDGTRERGRFFRYLSPGEVRIEVSAEGYGETVRTVQLVPGEKKRVDIDLEPVRTADIRLQTFPQGAAVYTDSRHAGSAPLTIDNAVLPAYLTLRRSGYHERNVLVTDDPGKEVLQYRLHPEEVDLERIVRNARDRFYLGLAGFFLSVPLTMYSYGKSTDYAFTLTAYPNASIEEKYRLHDLSELWYTAYLGSLFLNGTFLIDTIVQMVNYIDTVQAR